MNLKNKAKLACTPENEHKTIGQLSITIVLCTLTAGRNINAICIVREKIVKDLQFYYADHIIAKLYRSLIDYNICYIKYGCCNVFISISEF